jgi:AcrR family transcriptional regulator
MKPSKVKLRRQRAGRPPRIDPTRIVRTAIEIGLARVTVKGVAERLGVTSPALYRHVRNRDDIINLAVRELTSSRVQSLRSYLHWADVIRGAAFGMLDLLLSEPQLVCEIMNGTPDANGEVDFVEYFLQALVPFGFKPIDAIRIYHNLAMLAIGASVIGNRITSGYEEGLSHGESVTKALKRRPPDELPLLRKASKAFKELQEHQWQELLDLLIADIAAKRGEELPQKAV